MLGTYIDDTLLDLNLLADRGIWKRELLMKDMKKKLVYFSSLSSLLYNSPTEIIKMSLSGFDNASKHRHCSLCYS